MTHLVFRKACQDVQSLFVKSIIFLTWGQLMSQMYTLIKKQWQTHLCKEKKVPQPNLTKRSWSDPAWGTIFHQGTLPNLLQKCSLWWTSKLLMTDEHWSPTNKHLPYSQQGNMSCHIIVCKATWLRHRKINYLNCWKKLFDLKESKRWIVQFTILESKTWDS